VVVVFRIRLLRDLVGLEDCIFFLFILIDQVNFSTCPFCADNSWSSVYNLCESKIKRIVEACGQKQGYLYDLFWRLVLS
jgi:hypothetical protein